MTLSFFFLLPMLASAGSALAGLGSALGTGAAAGSAAAGLGSALGSAGGAMSSLGTLGGALGGGAGAAGAAGATGAAGGLSQLGGMLGPLLKQMQGGGQQGAPQAGVQIPGAQHQQADMGPMGQLAALRKQQRLGI